jgi:protein-disulfide isomerase
MAGVLGASKDVQMIFKHAPSSRNPNSFLAHEAALAAGAQGKFWEMYGALFGNQQKLAASDLLAYARRLNLDLASFQQALDNHTYRPIIERDLAEARGLGVTTTPTFFVNGRRLVGPQGYASLGAVIETLLADIPQNQRVREKIAASGPAQAIGLEHAPFKGPVAALVSLVEFSDFECPFCAEAAPVVQQLLAAYPTEVRLSFKHYPLSMHRESPLAHEAALAAGDQGKFWEMHDLLFAGQDKLTRDDLIAKAAQLRLDVSRFTKDLDSHRFRAAVESDRQEGDRLGVDGTPFFFINGHSISGAVSLADFKKLIDVALKEAAPPEAK